LVKHGRAQSVPGDFYLCYSYRNKFELRQMYAIETDRNIIKSGSAGDRRHKDGQSLYKRQRHVEYQ
jgi:hypothetical protein